MTALKPFAGSSLNSPQRLLAAYESLLARSTRMLACVREHNWFELVEEQSCYVVEVELISKAESAIKLSEAEKEHKAKLLEKILEQDMEIRQRLIERRNQLQKQMGTAQRRRDLARSYGVRKGFDQGAS
ncbi:flagellar protein FliT [Microbulbifer thermotolerans]|uniref:Flagellar protein FliT n=1 Tax=Microbulbifer thermotolerans TaxID=252514 RepID=A0A143HP00_MICTH|nr:flagellar protein FliT [Microbulbifer thermotolerans]AMX03160.1 hypothetical protein A3224_11775 [Microbulbifer thermotolerans]MCX2783461.1 flagellar protein FliT [Microbulbifer thermotolerans]MCX2835513.1 flagellar protein FliT [Microbulbifer thermotolerans]SFC62728.1 flagellar protein FliT [Microbulbifer thermotolerans]